MATENSPQRKMTAARLTPAGRGAVATIRIVGKSGGADSPKQDQLDSLFAAANGLLLSQQPLGTVAFGKWGTTHGEDLTVCRTQADVLEIHCHGGDSAVQRILDDLQAAKIDVVTWEQQWTDQYDELEAECQHLLSRATTWKATRIALDQAGGLLRNAYHRLLAAPNDGLQLDEIGRLLQWSEFGLHLATPWNVVLTGRPNVGKSSLINALLGYERAIVFNQPGTTRDVITGDTAIDGWPVVLADTAGIRRNAGELEAAGIELAQERLRTADLRIVVIDLSQDPTEDDIGLLAQWPTALIVANKADLADHWSDELPESALRVSSTTGSGLVELREEIARRLVPMTPTAGTAIPITRRQVQLLEQAGKTPDSAVRRKILEELSGTRI